MAKDIKVVADQFAAGGPDDLSDLEPDLVAGTVALVWWWHARSLPIDIRVLQGQDTRSRRPISRAVIQPLICLQLFD